MDKKKINEFETLYKEYAPKMYGLAYKMVRNHHDALDIVQESFIKAYKNISKFRGDSSLSTWLFRITLNYSYDFLRKKQKEKKIEVDRELEDNKKYFGEAKIIREDVAQLIKKEIEKLPPKQKAIFILKTYEGLKYEEIANITKSRIGTVKATYFQVIQKFKKKLYIKEVIKDEL